MTQLHAVLIGIDAYGTKPLHGCVNDVDAIQRLLLGRAGVPRANIRRLASPHPGVPHETSIGGAPATLGNIRSTLEELAAQVQEGDRVLLFYSGHGTRVSFSHPGGYEVFREALVPVDVNVTTPQRLLFDHELNEILAGIARRTRSVTCVLDCCHSAGVTRDTGMPGTTSRSLDPVQHLRWTPPPLASAPGPKQDDDRPRRFGDCHVVAACLDFELAIEGIGNDGVPHGLLTNALLRALAGIPDPELHAVTWARIWGELRAGVERRNPWQHLWMAGNPARAVLAGPPVDADPGLSIRRAGNVYEIDAGTLSSVTETALIAVYDDRRHLPALGSAEDRAARRGLLRVTSATLSGALAVVEGAPFELQPGARGRLVEPGRAARLRCAILPPDEAIAAALQESSLLELVPEPQAQVRLVQAGDRWLLTDDVHAETEDDALLVLRPQDRAHVRQVLDHYFRYALPLRMAESVRDLPGALRLEVLACTHELSPADAQAPDLPEAPTLGTSAYDLRSGAPVCFRVHNTSYERLRVALLNSASSGRVQILGNAVLDGGSAYTFWAGGALGKPFMMTLPPNKRQGIDRIVAVGTTAMSTELGHLRVDQRFVDVLGTAPAVTRSFDKDIGGDPTPVEQWTATQVLIKTRA